MLFEPILIFFLLFKLRKTLKSNGDLPEWQEKLKLAMIGVVVLCILQQTLSINSITAWIWHLAMLFIVAFTYKRNEFISMRSILLSVLPLVLIFLVKDLITLINISWLNPAKNYIGVMYPFAIIWMVAMFIISRKQQKALDKERQKREQEEQQNRIIAAKKDELEQMVTERTTEINKQKEELIHALSELKATQSQLIQSEKMASLGELTAGIAHEIQNPLNFVNNFSEVNKELIDEMNHELVTGNYEEAMAIANDIKENEQKIIHHGKRADAIVKGMLQHSRISTGQKEPTDINALADEYLRLSFHGLRAKDKSFNASMQTNFDEHIGKLDVVAQDMGRVLLNLFNNAFYAVTEKKQKLNENKTSENTAFEPMVTVQTKKLDKKIEINVSDNGNGIPQKIAEKIFQPFFTTKPTGHGTGLGLSLSYEIIKSHGGTIKMQTKEGEGTEFIIELPIL